MAKQTIKYESTTIDPTKSANEIQELVRRYGGTRFEQRWHQGILTGIRFAIHAEGIGEVPVRLEAQTETIEAILSAAARKKPSYSYLGSRPLPNDVQVKIREQAYRIAWRQLKDFVEQALLAVETGLFNIGAAFMAHVEVQDQGENITMSEFLLRRATMAIEGEALRILPANEAPIVRALPPAREVGSA